MERITRSARHLNAYKRHELLSGECVYPLPEYYTGYGNAAIGRRSEDLSSYVTEEMKADWTAHREQLMALWNGEIDEQQTWGDRRPWLCLFPVAGELPWAACMFDSPAPTRRRKTGTRS